MNAIFTILCRLTMSFVLEAVQTSVEAWIG